ncbi:MAG: hypothetical protein ACK55I_00145, partial [bacterium]
DIAAQPLPHLPGLLLGKQAGPKVGGPDRVGLLDDQLPAIFKTRSSQPEGEGQHEGQAPQGCPDHRPHRRLRLPLGKLPTIPPQAVAGFNAEGYPHRHADNQ